MPLASYKSRYKPLLPFVPPNALAPGADEQSLAVGPSLQDLGDQSTGPAQDDSQWSGGGEALPKVQARQSIPSISQPPPSTAAAPNRAMGPPSSAEPPAEQPPSTPPAAAAPATTAAPTEDEPIDYDAKRKAALAKIEANQNPTPVISNWAQRLGGALLAATKLAPYANMIVHPKWSEQERSRQAQLQAAEGTLKDIDTAEAGEAQAEQRSATAEQKREQAADYAARETERQRATEAGERTRKLSQNEKLEQQLLKPWGEDAQLQKEGDPVPQGMETTQSLTQPGMVWVHPPSMVPLTEDLAQFAPGHKTGDLIPYSEFKKAQATAGETAKGVAVAGAKAPGNTPLDQQYVNEYLRLHPGSTVADAVKQHAKDAQAPERPERPPQALMINPSGVAELIRPGSQVTPGSQTPAGVNAVSTPTMQMRNVAAQAGLVHEQTPMMLAELDRLQSKVGAVSGRWNEFMQGKVGLDDPDMAGLRTDLLMYSSAVALMHARGRLPENLRKEFDDAINSPKQSAGNLKTVIQHIDGWTAKNMNAMGSGANTGGRGADPLGIR